MAHRGVARERFRIVDGALIGPTDERTLDATVLIPQ